MKKAEVMLLVAAMLLSIAACSKEENVLSAQSVEKPVAAPVTSGLCEQSEIVGRTELAEYNVLNRKMDLNYVTDVKTVMCREEQSGDVYYCNLGGDYFLYRLKDGVSELAVAMPVNSVSASGGKVYFTVHDFGVYTLEGMHKGDIYCYTPGSGSVGLVYEAGAAEISVRNGVLYYSVQEMRDGVSVIAKYVLELESETEPVKDINLEGEKVWREYMVTYLHNPKICGVELVEWTNQENKITVLKDTRPFSHVVWEDKFYYDIEKKVCWVDLLTGETEEVDFAETFDSWSSNDIADFTFTEGNLLWATDHNALFCVNIATGECWSFKGPERTAYLGGVLYTDGEYVYATYQKNGRNDPNKEFVRLECNFEEMVYNAIPVTQLGAAEGE